MKVSPKGLLKLDEEIRNQFENHFTIMMESNIPSILASHNDYKDFSLIVSGYPENYRQKIPDYDKIREQFKNSLLFTSFYEFCSEFYISGYLKNREPKPSSRIHEKLLEDGTIDFDYYESLVKDSFDNYFEKMIVKIPEMLETKENHQEFVKKFKSSVSYRAFYELCEYFYSSGYSDAVLDRSLLMV